MEFLEHVGLNYHFNYISAFRKAAVLFVTSSRWGGWHHVEVHDDEWWKLKYQAYGFVYSEKLTQQVREWAQNERGQAKAPNGSEYNPQHVWLSMKVFINPAVASLPEHAHLFYEPGCFDGRNQHRLCEEGINVAEVAMESKLPEGYLPVKLTPEMDTKWEQRIKEKVLAKMEREE